MTANLYESPKLQKITGRTIRPGGLSLTEKAVSLCRFKKNAKILDVGCGAGASLDFLRDDCGLNVVGIDRSSLLLNQCRRRSSGLSLVRADAAGLPFSGSAFHALFCECVLSLTPDPAAVLREFYRVLMPGAFLILTDIYLRFPAPSNEEKAPVNTCLNGAAEKKDILPLVRGAGFNIFLWEDQTPLLTSLAARMVFEYGSMEKFWSSFCQSGKSGCCGNRAAGYYFLAAKKVG